MRWASATIESTTEVSSAILVARLGADMPAGAHVTAHLPLGHRPPAGPVLTRSSSRGHRRRWLSQMARVWGVKTRVPPANRRFSQREPSF